MIVWHGPIMRLAAGPANVARALAALPASRAAALVAWPPTRQRPTRFLKLGRQSVRPFGYGAQSVSLLTQARHGPAQAFTNRGGLFAQTLRLLYGARRRGNHK